MDWLSPLATSGILLIADKYPWVGLSAVTCFEVEVVRRKVKEEEMMMNGFGRMG
jgi:hypothetical protein